MQAGGAAEHPVLLLQVQDREFLDHVEQAQQAGDELREHRGIACARHAHLQVHDAENIQHHVEQRGENQEIQRRAAVAQGAQDAGEQIVENVGKRAGKDDDDVVICHVDNVIRRVHGNKQRAAHGHAQRRHHNAQHNAQQDRHGHRVAHAVIVARAEALRHQHGEAARHAHDEAENEERQRTRGADGRQRVHAEELAHDDGVHHAVKLLKKVADQQRDRKTHDKLDGISHGHIPCHRFDSLPFLG